MNDYKMYILGARGSHSVSGVQFTEFGGDTSCYILKNKTHAIILDCGTGLYNAQELLQDCTQVDILLSHLHYDHVIGVLRPVFRKDVIVNVYAEFTEFGGIDVVKKLLQPPFWPVRYGNLHHVDVQSEHGGVIFLQEDVKVSWFAGNHPNYASIIRIDMPGCSLCYATDYEHSNFVFPKEAVEGCSIFMYDGMYLQEEYAAHKGWGHSTWLEGCKIGKEYGVPNMFIIHHNPTKTDEELNKIEEEAKSSYPNVWFARQGTEIKL
ncbi:MBL fold metallo-hydrolase [Chakrabartyella piscis]|uniref:MBL fold metallo-hydrolase n=1 Tax=Chakrabartyella piscis TaxID=2918914 RepID=UPI002958369A|nr:MBL fold metallo-hydrolase [Chakrabartyella piscis]